jgi:hypothetical protein
MSNLLKIIKERKKFKKERSKCKTKRNSMTNLKFAKEKLTVKY